MFIECLHNWHLCMLAISKWMGTACLSYSMESISDVRVPFIHTHKLHYIIVQVESNGHKTKFNKEVVSEASY